jgi:hypothetical protein
MFKRLFLYSLVGVVMVGFLFARVKRKPDPVAVDRAEPTVGADGVTSVGSIRLFQDYDANEVAADNRYKGKPVRVTGRVFAVEKNLMEAAVLGLSSGNAIFQTMATLTPDATPRAAALAKGDTVVLQCTGAGSMMRMPQLDHCVLVRP